MPSTLRTSWRSSPDGTPRVGAVPLEDKAQSPLLSTLRVSKRASVDRLIVVLVSRLDLVLLLLLLLLLVLVRLAAFEENLAGGDVTLLGPLRSTKEARLNAPKAKQKKEGAKTDRNNKDRKRKEKKIYEKERLRELHEECSALLSAALL